MIQSVFVPLLFIFLYGSGFVFTALGLENSSPMAFLALRFFIAFMILLFISYIFKLPWPRSLKEYFHISLAGVLSVGIFSLGVFLSLDFGLSATLSSLIIALQPLVVSLLAAKYLNESFNKKILFALFLGLMGVFFVLSSKFTSFQSDFLAIVFSFLALFGLSFGNIYQKKFCSNMNLYSGGAIQTLSSSFLVLPLLLFYEDIYINFNGDFLLALFYMSVIVSIIALSLLYFMIKKADVSKVASLFYLIPVSASIVSYFVLDTKFDIFVFIGILFVIISILIINKK